MGACAAALLATLLAACGGEAPPAGSPTAGPDAPVTAAPSPGGPPAPEPSPMLVRPRSGLEDVRPRPWESYEEIGPRSLLVTFWSGVEECYGLDRVEVDEEPERVTITLHEGVVPGDRPCIEIAVWKGVRVRLESPLGDRIVIDGAPED